MQDCFFHELPFSSTQRLSSTRSHLRFTWTVSFLRFTKLENLHRAASRSITSFLSPSPITFLLTEVSLPPLRVNLTHFALSSHERTLCLPICFPFQVWPDLGETYTLQALGKFLLPLTFSLSWSREGLSACFTSPPWSHRPSVWSSLFPLHALVLTLLLPRCGSFPLDSLHSHNFGIQLMDILIFHLLKEAAASLPTA